MHSKLPLKGGGRGLVNNVLGFVSMDPSLLSAVSLVVVGVRRLQLMSPGSNKQSRSEESTVVSNYCAAALMIPTPRRHIFRFQSFWTLTQTACHCYPYVFFFSRSVFNHHKSGKCIRENPQCTKKPSPIQHCHPLFSSRKYMDSGLVCVTCKS